MSALNLALAVLSGRASPWQMAHDIEGWEMLRDAAGFESHRDFEQPDADAVQYLAETVIIKSIESNQQQIAQLTTIVTELQNSIKTT